MNVLQLRRDVARVVMGWSIACFNGVEYAAMPTHEVRCIDDDLTNCRRFRPDRDLGDAMEVVQKMVEDWIFELSCWPTFYKANFRHINTLGFSQCSHDLRLSICGAAYRAKMAERK